MVKSEIYIGLHDSTTKTQLFESEKYIRVLRNVCHSYKVPFSFGIQEGGYIYENGEYARETSLVLTLIDVEKAVVNDIAKDLCAFFRQCTYRANHNYKMTEDTSRQIQHRYYFACSLGVERYGIYGEEHYYTV